jgi:tetratricopeptide (TPR) repeat protein
MKQFAVLIVWCCLSSLRLSAGHFEFTSDIGMAYEQATSLRFNDARLTLHQVRRHDPNNLLIYHIENYIDFLTLYLNQSEADYKRLKKNQEARLLKIQTGNSESPYYLYAQADLRLQWALVKLSFGEYLAAFNDISKAHKLLQRNQEKFPDFILNLKDLGVLHALAGTIPDSYKWSAKVLGGLEGSVAQGRKELKTALQLTRQHSSPFKAEIAVMYAGILLYLDNDGNAAWQVLQSADLQPRQNPLHCYVLANVAMRSQRNDQAIELLKQCPRGTEFASAPYLDFMLGLAKLRRLDSDAGAWFYKFLAHQRSNHGVKETYQKLAWIALLQGNTTGYREHMQSVLTNGKSNTGADKDALQEARAARIADVRLVKARLLFDGGYYQKAYDVLQELSAPAFQETAHQLEYFYRLGRILHGLGRYDEALEYYQKAIEQGHQTSYFFACNAALQAGLIHELRRHHDKAREYYRLCLSMHPNEYKAELHQKAKSALERLP